MHKLFILFQYCVPQHALSRLVGKFAASKHKAVKSKFIQYFIKKYDISLSEAERENPEDYHSFNDFFCRSLKPGARPIVAGATIASPADGAFSQLGDIKDGRIFQAKNHSFSTEELLANTGLAEHFKNGLFATIYLSPKDYHRVHMPISGDLKSTSYIPGDLFSVNTQTTESVPRLFARNERLVCTFDTEIGPVVSVMVGAMIVAGIETVWEGNVAPAPTRHIVHRAYSAGEVGLNKGDEMGRFKLGSTVVLLFPEKSIRWSENIGADSPIKMGEKIADIL